MTTPLERDCDTLVEFLDRIAIGRGGDLHPQDSPCRKMIGFMDAGTGEWFLMGRDRVSLADSADPGLRGVCARLGKGVPEVLLLLRSVSGMRVLVRKTETKKGG